jgi:steroid 5-alpha reductase family enzyme
MFSLSAYLVGLALAAAVAVLTWVIATLKKDVSIVDSLWSLMFILLAGTYALRTPISLRGELVLLLVSIWGLRLSLYITWRNRGHGEDRRYQAIRRRNQPNFALKSLWIVFLLQALLAWIISLPLLAAINSNTPVGVLDAAGFALWLIGLVFEAGGDWQLARFKANPANQGKVMDRGLWRVTRHPNYFGDFCIWWGFYLLALAGGGWWSFVGPLLMAVLLMRVSGVTLLERDIGKRRPEYADYVRRTSAFFPRRPKA